MSTFSELIDFTRSSTGTYLDSVVYGDELVTNGTFDSDSDWDKAPEWTIANGVATFDDVNNANLQQFNMGLVVGKSYLFSFEITSGATPNFSLFASGSSDQYTGYETFPVGTHQLVFTCTGGTGIRIAASKFLGTAFSIDNVSVKEVIGGQGTAGTPLLRTAAINEPRLEYDASGQPLGLLIEEQRTNKLTYSQDYTQSEWLKESVTVATAPVAAPDGTMTATHVVRTGSAGTGHLVDTNVVTTSDRHSIWARTVSGTGTMYIAFHDSDTYKVTLTEEWQRFDVQCNNAHVYAVNFRGSATLTECYIWGSQAETGTFPTSYIPTSGSTVTRNKDVCKVTAFKYHQNDQQGTLFVEGTPNISQATYRRFAEFEYSNLRFSIQTYTGKIASYTRNAANSTNNSIGTQNPYTPYRTQKSAFTVSAGYAAKSNNGLDVQSETDVLGLDEPNVDLYIGQQDNTADQLCGHIKRVLYFPTKLSNDKLVELTKPSSSPTMSLTFDGQATSELVEGLHD